MTCPECQGKAYLVPQHEYNIYSRGYHTSLDDPSDFGDDIFRNDYSNPYHAFCETCGKVVDCYDYSGEIRNKQSKFENIMFDWFADADDDVINDVRVRYDIIEVHVIGKSRAIIKHYINADQDLER